MQSLPIFVIVAIVAIAAGVALGFVLRKNFGEKQLDNARDSAGRIVADAEKQAETLRKEAILEAKDEVFRLRADAETEAKERRKEITGLEARLLQREESIERRAESIDASEHQLSSTAGQVEKRSKDIEAAIAEEKARLESLAGMTADEAKQVLLKRVEDDVKHDAAIMIREVEAQAR